jgi:hypothetical protein
MSLGALIRSALATANTVTADLQVEVEHEAWTGYDSDAKPTYASANTYGAIVEKRQRRFKMASGEEIVSQHRVTILTPVEENGTAGRSEPIDTRDRLTLPDDSTGPILSVEGVLDPSTGQPYMTSIWMG